MGPGVRRISYARWKTGNSVTCLGSALWFDMAAVYDKEAVGEMMLAG